MADADITTVTQAWIEAVNAGDEAAAMHELDDDVGIHGPRGLATGKRAVADWIAKTGIRFDAPEHEVFGPVDIVKASATWADRETGGDARTPATEVIMALRVNEGKITSIQRFTTMAEALSSVT